MITMSEIATLNKSILGLSGTIENFIKSMGSFEKASESAKKKVTELTKAQEALGLTIRNGELISKRTGNRVNEFGQEVTKVGDKMLAFNKRSAILNETIKELNKSNERFNLGMKSFNEYQKRGGNLAEYLAEFISSSREEITIFGVEAAKARKVMYGFLPPGVFRILNKFSSTLQLFGGQYRKLVTDSGAAKDEIEALKEALKFATEEKEIQGLQERLADLETPDNLFTTIFTKFGKLKKLMANPLPLNFDQEGINEMDSYAQKAKSLFLKNFTITLTPDKKDELKKTKDLVKSLRKPIQVNQNEMRKARDAKASLLGVSNRDVKKTKKAYDDITEKVKKMEANLVAVSVANPAMAKNFRKSLDTLKKDQEQARKEMLYAETDYQAEVEKVAGKVSDYDPNIKRLKDLEKYTNRQKELEEEGIKGVRKVYTDLYKDFGQMQKVFKEGMDNSEAILGIETSMGKLSGEIANAEATMEALVSRAEMFPDNPEYFDSVIKQQEALNELFERQENLQGALLKKQVEQSGLKELKTKIADNKTLIEQAEEMKIRMSEQLEFEKKRVAEAKELISAGGLSKKALENAQKEIEQGEINIAGAYTNLQKADEDIETAEKENEQAKEQIALLKDMREASIDKLLDRHPFFKGINKLRKGLKNIIPMLGQALRAFMMGFIYISLAILGILALVKIFGPTIKETFTTVMKFISPLLEYAMGFATMIFDGAKKVFGAFFGNGTFEDAIDGLFEIAIGLLGFASTLIIAALVALGAFIVLGTKIALKKIIAYVKGMFTSTKKFLKGMVIILAIVGTIVALIMGAPVWLAVVIGLVIFKVGSKLVKPIKKAVDFIVKIARGIKKAISDIWPLAEGGTVKNNGVQLVGEKGPELVSLPKGSQVFSNKDSVGMVKNAKTMSNGTTNNISITINAKDTSRAEMDRIAREVSRTITNSIQRQSNTSNLR